jgi:PKD repeat protein
MRHRLFIILVMSLLILFLPIFIRNSHSDQAPTASFTYSPAIPGPGDTITFDASASLAPNGWITSYTWDFGDGTVTTTSDPTITHSYPIDGNYTVQLTVTDNGGLTGTAVAVIQIQKDVNLRICIAGTVVPLANVQVTVYYKSGTAWAKAPARSANPGVYVEYDNVTQPNKGKAYRNPGFTASVLLNGATNIAFDIHPSDMIVFFKIQWGSNVAYWPNDTNTYYRYNKNSGKAVVYNFEQGEKPYWDNSAGTYVIKAAYIKSGECEGNTPIIAGVYCPPPSQQWYLAVKTDPTGITTIPGEGFYTNNTSVTLTAPTYANVLTNARYRFNYWDVDGTSQGSGINPITVLMRANHTATAHYLQQYYLTVTSAYDSPTPLSGWFDTGTSIVASVSTPISGPSGTRYACSGWTGTGSVPASGASPSVTFTITQPSSITWNWKTQYQLTVTSPYDSPTPITGWFDYGTIITASVTSPASGPSGTRYVCTGWTGTGSVPASGASSSVTFTITQPSSITWNWKTQYYLTVSSPYDSPTPTTGWFDNGSSLTASVTSPASGPSGTRYVCTGWTGTGSVPASGASPSIKHHMELENPIPGDF